MSKTNTTHDDVLGPFAIAATMAPGAKATLHGAKEIPVGWLCPRCSKVNAPHVEQCSCEPETLPHTVVGPSETK